MKSDKLFYINSKFKGLLKECEYISKKDYQEKGFDLEIIKVPIVTKSYIKFYLCFKINKPKKIKTIKIVEIYSNYNKKKNRLEIFERILKFNNLRFISYKNNILEMQQLFPTNKDVLVVYDKKINKIKI